MLTAVADHADCAGLTRQHDLDHTRSGIDDLSALKDLAHQVGMICEWSADDLSEEWNAFLWSPEGSDCRKEAGDPGDRAGVLSRSSTQLYSRTGLVANTGQGAFGKICCSRIIFYWYLLTLLGPQSRFGDKLLENWVVCPHNGTAVLKGLKHPLCRCWGKSSAEKRSPPFYRQWVRGWDQGVAWLALPAANFIPRGSLVDWSWGGSRVPSWSRVEVWRK